MAGPIAVFPDGKWEITLRRPAGASVAFARVVEWAEAAIELCGNLLIVGDPETMNIARRRVLDITLDAGHTMRGDAESEFIYNYKDRMGTYRYILDGLYRADDLIDSIVDAIPEFIRETRRFIAAVTIELATELERVHAEVQWWSERLDPYYRNSADRGVLDRALDAIDRAHRWVGSPLYTVDEGGLLRRVENALDQIITATNDAVDQMAEWSRQVDGQREAMPLIAAGLRDEWTGFAPDTLSPGIRRILGETLTETPTLVNLLRRLESSGWVFAYGDEGLGSRVDAVRKRVMVDGKGVRDPSFAMRELAHMAARARYVENYGEAALRTNPTARATAKAYGVLTDAMTQLQLYQARAGVSMPIVADYFDRFPADVRDIVISYTFGQEGDLHARLELAERFLLQERTETAPAPQRGSNPPQR